MFSELVQNNFAVYSRVTAVKDSVPIKLLVQMDYLEQSIYASENYTGLYLTERCDGESRVAQGLVSIMLKPEAQFRGATRHVKWIMRENKPMNNKDNTTSKHDYEVKHG